MKLIALFSISILLLTYYASCTTCVDCKTVIIPTEDVPGCLKYDWVETDSKGTPVTALVANSISIESTTANANTKNILITAATAGSFAVILAVGAVICVAAVGFALICAALSVLATFGFCCVFKTAQKAAKKPEKYFQVDEKKKQQLIENPIPEAPVAAETGVGELSDEELSDGGDN